MTSSARAAYAFARLRGIARPRVRVARAPSGVTADWDVPVAARDGTVLRVNVFRPAGGGRSPAIMSMHPYGKDRLPGRGRLPSQYRMLRQTAPVAFSAWTSWEAPDPAFWVPRGYAVVNCDLRGCGTSGGVGDILTDQEAQDCFDLTAWAAEQPWSTGKVGLNGVSYLAISQYKVAALRPPALAAICPWEGFTDAYRDLMRPGGIRGDGFVRIWTRQLRSQRLQGDAPLTGRTAAARRVVAVAGPGPHADRGTDAGLRQLLRPLPAQRRVAPRLRANGRGPALALHAPQRQVGDVLLLRGARRVGTLLRPLPEGSRQRPGRTAGRAAGGPRWRRRPRGGAGRA